MNVIQTSLEALILKATHESLPKPDAAALEAFCTVMRDSPDGPQFAAQALAARIHARNPKEAILALVMLDRCMHRCDANFHAEIGKFRFLNEMIKLVSPKYLANQTSPDVRTRVLQLLYTWSSEYPKETKFKVAFEMLKSQGVVKEPIALLIPEEPVVSKPRSKCSMFEDEEKSKLLQKLLQSKKPEDLQHANRLIKTMVREDEHRTEVNSRRSQEVFAALDSADLLKEMLKNAADATPDEEQLIHELHASCVRLRPGLQQIAAADAVECLGDIINASDALGDVIDKYQQFFTEKKNREKALDEDGSKGNVDHLLDFAGANTHPAEKASKSTIEDLGDIFCKGPVANNTAELLKPVSLMTNEDVELLDDKNKKEGWKDLDSLGEQLLKESLPENAKRHDNFNIKKNKKIPMNAIEKPAARCVTQHNNTSLLDLDFFVRKPTEEKSPESSSSSPHNDDLMVDISEVTEIPQKMNNNNCLSRTMNSHLASIMDSNVPLVNESKTQTNHDSNTDRNKSEVKPLTDIQVTLDNVQPSKVPPLTALEEPDGVTVVLHFCKDKPRPDVSVIVISTTSKIATPISDYKFQSVVPKGCKVRLLTPSGTSLPAYNPFLPPPALTQVMLLARPASMSRINMKFVITYVSDEDTVSEIGVVNDLPLEHI